MLTTEAKENDCNIGILCSWRSRSSLLPIFPFALFLSSFLFASSGQSFTSSSLTFAAPLSVSSSHPVPPSAFAKESLISFTHCPFFVCCFFHSAPHQANSPALLHPFQPVSIVQLLSFLRLPRSLLLEVLPPRIRFSLLLALCLVDVPVSRIAD